MSSADANFLTKCFPTLKGSTMVGSIKLTVIRSIARIAGIKSAAFGMSVQRYSNNLQFAASISTSRNVCSAISVLMKERAGKLQYKFASVVLR
jgi:hypothetical protein